MHSITIRIMFLLLCAMASIVNADTFDIPKIDGITIDGKADDWQSRGLHVGVMSRWDRTSPSSQLTGEADLRVGWDDQGLLLLLQHEDAIHLEDLKHWKLDSIELFMFEAPGAMVGCQAAITPGLDEKFNTLRWQFYKDTRPKGSGKLTLDAARTPTDTGYLMEVRMPWANLGITPATGQSVGFQMIINDADMSRDRQDIQFVCWFADKNTYLDSTKMHRLRLSKESDAPAITDTILTHEQNVSQLNVHSLAEFAGKKLTVKQDDRIVGSATLDALKEQHLSHARLALEGLDTSAKGIDLYADQQHIGHFGFYKPVPEKLKPVLRQALQTADEKLRFKLMKTLLQEETIDPMLRADIENLIITVDGWANNYDRAVADRLSDPDHYLDAVCAPGIPLVVRSDSPVFPIYCLYRARNLIHWVIEYYGNLGRDTKTRNDFYGLARNLLKQAQMQVPDNPIINMYLEQPIPWPATFTADVKAPAWANEQREAIEKLTDIIHWWIANRQLPNGSYGGEWGDDCEMWRSWVPILVGFDDPVIAQAQRLLSDGMFKQKRLADGYTNESTDVEHTAEDSADTITPMLHLKADDKQWQARALRIGELMDKLWTGTNERGHRQFKSVVFSSRGISNQPVDACDTIYHPRVVQPTLLLWQRTNDPQLTKLFTPWLDSWVDATASTAKGKPAGILPSAIHWPEGTPGGISDKWWRPGAFRDSTLYAWPSSMPILLNTLLLGYHVTGNEQYLEPIRSMAQIRQQYIQANPNDQADITQPVGTLLSDADNIPDDLTPGSLQWCAAQLNGPLNNGGTLAKYRFLTNDSRFDNLLMADANGYVRYRLSGDQQTLVDALNNTADAFRVNKEAYTSEVRFTDRVFRYPLAYEAHYTDTTPPSPDFLLLYGSITGDPGDALYFPMNAVKWMTNPRQIAALVTHTDNHQFQAQLYHFGNTARSLDAMLYQLKPGTYTVTLQAVGSDKPLSTHSLTVDSPQSRISLSLPAQQLCKLTIQ